MSRKTFQHLTHVSELIHMDVMGPMKNESLGEKGYLFVYEDDYSIFEFICEKYGTFTIFEAIFHHL